MSQNTGKHDMSQRYKNNNKMGKVPFLSLEEDPWSG
jgi:hypothetical protein